MRAVGTRAVAVVTGASRGLGLLLARELGARGHDLVICARSDEGLEAARDELAATGAPNPPSRRGCAR